LAAEKLCLIQVKYLPRLRCQTKAKLNSISMKIYIKKSWSVPRSLTKRKTKKSTEKSKESIFLLLVKKCIGSF